METTSDTTRHAAPALARGIDVLRALGAARRDPAGPRPATLDELASATGAPKSSLLRVLETLESYGLVTTAKARRGKQYQAAYRFAPLVAGSEVQFEERLGFGMRELAADTQRVVEWYVANEAGLVLVRRVEPPEALVSVRAELGFVRPWSGELEAVLAVGLAFWSEHASSAEAEFTRYVADGVQRALEPSEADVIIAQARERYCFEDLSFNGNGVRRTAAVVTSQHDPRGVLATAGHYLPGDEDEFKRTQALSALAARLSG